MRGCGLTSLVFVSVLAANLASAQLQHVQGINHPAAGPDFGNLDLAHHHLQSELFFEEDFSAADGLVDPDGRKIIAPLKQHQQRREKELEKEKEEIERVLAETKKPSVRPSPTLRTWLWALFGCSLVVCCGVLPAFLLPSNSSEFLHTPDGKRKLNLLLSFAVGSLLGDVFLHLLPETWASQEVRMDQIGLYTIAGLLCCFVVEKVCATTEESQHQVCAIMNLVGNMVDNFTHGLAVGASFLVGVKFGLLTTFAILIHEIPHEVSDFAILLRADYNRVDAAKAQLKGVEGALFELVTASGGVIGACFALFMNTETFMSDGISWILPFTAGGFINIALAQILPELMEETDRRQNMLQLLLMIAGVLSMGALNTLHH